MHQSRRSAAPSISGSRHSVTEPLPSSPEFAASPRRLARSRAASATTRTAQPTAQPVAAPSAVPTRSAARRAESSRRSRPPVETPRDTVEPARSAHQQVEGPRRSRHQSAAVDLDAPAPADRRRHRLTAPTVVPARVAPRSTARAQRAGKRRVARARAIAAVTLSALGVGIAAIGPGTLPFGSSDEVAVQQATEAMAPPDTLDDRDMLPPRPLLTTAEGTSPSATRTKTATTRKPPPARATTTTAASGRRGVVLDGRVMGGWYNGASGTGVTNGEFAAWLGQPLTLASTWADTSDEVQRTLSPLQDEYGDWKGALDIAVGGTILGTGENYAEAARGAYDDRWRAAAAVLAQKRKGKGATFVRPFHEMNCDWYANWMVTRENSADYKAAFRRYMGILRSSLPELYVVFSPNYGTCNDLPIDLWYPGDDIVDVVAPDYYNDYQDAANGSVAGWNDESDEYDALGNPQGPEAWRRWAASHGKPLAFPELGLKPAGMGGGDRPEWIKALNAWMTKHANTATWQIGEDIPKAAAGKVLYFAYFNVVHGGDAGFTIFGHGANQDSAPVYRSLKWGNNAAG